MAGFYGTAGLLPPDSPAIEPLPTVEPDRVESERVTCDGFCLDHFRHRGRASRIGRSRSGATVFSYVGFIVDPVDNGVGSTQDARLAEALAEAFERRGDALWPRLNGNWVAAAWETKQRRLTLASDRLATVQLHYACAGDTVSFGTSFLGMLRDAPVSRRVDLEGLVEFLTIGYALERRTVAEGISALPEATILKWCDGKLSASSYWVPDLSDAPGLTDAAATADRIDGLLTQAMERFSRQGKIGVSLSGGLDSRQIIARLGDRCRLASIYGDDSHPDVRCAIAVAKELGVRSRRVSLDEQEVGRNYGRWVELCDGISWVPEYLLMSVALTPECDVSLYGAMGDPLKGHIGCPEFPTPKNEARMLREAYVRDTMNFMFEHEHGMALGPAIPRELHGLPWRNYKRTFYAVEAPNLYKQFDWYNLIGRQRRRVGPALLAAQAYTEFRAPLTDSDFVELMLRMPPRMLADHDVYRLALVRPFERLALLPHNRGSNFVDDARGKASRRNRLRRVWFALPGRVRLMLYAIVTTPPAGVTRAAYRTTLAGPLKDALGALVDAGILTDRFVRRLYARGGERIIRRASLMHALVALGYTVKKYGLSSA